MQVWIITPFVQHHDLLIVVFLVFILLSVCPTFKVTSRLGSMDACWSDTVSVNSSAYRSWWKTLCAPMCQVITVLYRETNRTIIWWMTCWLTSTCLPSWTAKWAAGETQQGMKNLQQKAFYQSLSCAFVRYSKPWKWAFIYIMLYSNQIWLYF